MNFRTFPRKLAGFCLKSPFSESAGTRPLPGSDRCQLSRPRTRRTMRARTSAVFGRNTAFLVRQTHLGSARSSSCRAGRRRTFPRTSRHPPRTDPRNGLGSAGTPGSPRAAGLRSSSRSAGLSPPSSRRFRRFLARFYTLLSPSCIRSHTRPRTICSRRGSRTPLPLLLSRRSSARSQRVCGRALFPGTLQPIPGVCRPFSPYRQPSCPGTSCSTPFRQYTFRCTSPRIFRPKRTLYTNCTRRPRIFPNSSRDPPRIPRRTSLQSPQVSSHPGTSFRWCTHAEAGAGPERSALCTIQS